MRAARIPSALVVLLTLLFTSHSHAQTPPPAQSQVTAIRAGRLVDPESGRLLTNQIILVENGRFTQIGPNLAIPAGEFVMLT